ncbi:MAG: alpha/beta fold hydrolase [Acidimicrobiales bacterium]
MTGAVNSSGLWVDCLPSDAGPDSPLVVLVHGSMDRHTSFARIRSRLMASCDVVSYDRRGYALSRDARPGARGVLDHAADLEAVVDGRPCTVFGHSYGGTVTLAFAARRPDLVASAVAYEPPLAWREGWPHRGEQPPQFRDVSPEQAAENFLRRMIGDRYDRLPLKTRQEVLKDGPALVAELTAIRLDPAPFDPGAVAVPVMVVCGSESSQRHKEATSWLSSQLPNGTLHMVEGAGHGGHQSHPAEVTSLILGAVAVGRDPSAGRPPALV